MRFIRLCFIAISAAVILVGCSSENVKQKSAQADSVVPEGERDLSDEQRIEMRVQSRWQAMIDEDLERAYSFASPAYRQAYSLQDFVGLYGSQVQRTKVSVDAVEILGTQPPTANVELTLYFQFVMESGQAPIETGSLVKEKWIKIDGNWWRVEKTI